MIDATCPLVTKVHLEALKFAREKRTIILIGHKDHQEIVGTSGEAPDRTIVVDSVDAVDALEVEDPEKLSFLTQTTLSLYDTQEIVARFHSQADAERALEDFNHRAKGGVPDDIPSVTLAGAPLAVGQLLKQAGLVPSTSEALRNIEQNGVKIDGTVVSDKALKLDAGEYVVQVGKRRFARITLTA